MVHQQQAQRAEPVSGAPPGSWGFSVSSVVPAPPEAVWARVTTFEGVNHELMPIARMTCPAALRRIDPEAVPLGRRWFRSWLLLFGVVPFDYDDLCLLSIEPGRSFHEASTMLSQRRWVHRRSIEPAGTGTRITDQVEFEPRVRALGWLMRRVLPAVFRHRHRRLVAYFDHALRERRTRQGG